MDRKLNWIKAAFNRTTDIFDDGQLIGQMHRHTFGADVEAYLNAVRLRFDVTGFLRHSVNLHDQNNTDQIIGTITFSFGKRAELQLTNGETYQWRRHNILMRDWDMIREGDGHTNEHEAVNYVRTRQFLADHGDITVEAGTPHAEVIVLTGLFIRNYFQRRRRVAAAAGVVIAAGG